MHIIIDSNWNLSLVNYTWGFNFMDKRYKKIIAFITAISCVFLPLHNFDMRFTNAPKLISDNEIESTNDRKKVKC